ncbi:MAG: aromatic amino acid lyase, partial [Chlamydiia bacterium]|nr:aromatic amino acid lyase [Chlamydiia bacterium]
MFKEKIGLKKENNNLKEQTQIVLDGKHLTTSNVFKAASDFDVKVVVTQETERSIVASRKTLNDFVKDGRIIYGVNTGVGGFVDWLVPNSYSEALQKNLISAVATNVGEYLDDSISRAAMIIRLNSLARGTSAISIENFNKLLEIYNAGIIPCIPSKGSLGASGDLGPLACIALVAIGEWKAKYKGEIISGKAALKKAGIEPMQLSFKEGLSLVNGTSVMTGLAAILIEQA